MFCKLPCVFFFVGKKVDTDHFKYDIIPSLKTKDVFKFSPDAAMNHLWEKVKPWCKLSYKVFEEQDGYDQLLEISKF